ncbi:hypothetical protein IGI04_038092, partial [Brassica rapa subsp. trilocularis]
PTTKILGHTRFRRRGQTLRLRRRPRFETTPGTNRRFTRIHRSSLTPHHHHRKRLQLKSHLSPFIASTERKTSREPSPLTMVELRSSSDVVSTNPNQTKSKKLKGKNRLNPKTELGNQPSARQGMERLHLP